MSEKRFSVRLRSECDRVVYSFFDGDKPLDVDMIVDLLNELAEENEQLRQSHNKSECFYCEYCFRDDNYGVCCENKNSKHFTPHWDLHWEIITDCNCFKRVGDGV